MKTFCTTIAIVLACQMLSGAQRTSIEEFFTRHLDTTLPGLESIPALIAAKDVTGAEKLFADYIRRTLPVDKMVPATWRKPGREEYPQGSFAEAAFHIAWCNTDPQDLSKIRDEAERVMGYKLISCGTPHQFPVGKVDWSINPTYNKYCEWPWGLNRHYDLNHLARYYLATGDERAAQTYVQMLDSWIDQMTAPADDEPYWSPKSVGWRTISTGIRMVGWFHQFPAFIKSPAVTDHFIAKYYTSVWEHGHRLATSGSGRGNWILIEKQGHIRIPVYCPFLKDAPAWKRQCEATYVRELQRQFYPDGFQIELTTNYHSVSVESFLATCFLYRDNGLVLPPEMLKGMEKAMEIYVRIQDPSGYHPDLNDGTRSPVAQRVKLGRRLFPENPVFRDPPPFLSCSLPYAGAAIFRDSWGPKAVWGYFDGGPFGTGHQHEDKLNFLLYAYGKNMLIEAGSYAYDTSEMRRYVLSTRGHNTVMFDGLEQNQRASYRWHDPDVNRKSDLVFSTSTSDDCAEASYTAGYGPRRLPFRHRRRVEFHKRSSSPYFVITDTFTAPDNLQSHTYSILWHLEECRLACGKSEFTADFGDGVKLTATWDDPEATVADHRGEKQPMFQGWFPIHAAGPHEHRPIPTPIVTGSFKGEKTVVTILRPGVSHLKFKDAPFTPH